MDDVLSAGYAVLRDHPEFFYYKPNTKAYFNGAQVTLELHLLYTPAEIATMKVQLERKIAQILQLIPPGACLWEKERIVFEYLQLHTSYVDDDAPERYNIIGALLQGQAVCEGISKAFAVLCHRIGIPCIVVFSQTHMWNLVNLNGKLANVDATYSTDAPHPFCDYTYFNARDCDMGNEEHCKEILCVPCCSDGSNSYYEKMNLSFGSALTLKKYVIKALLTHKNPIRVKLRKGNIIQAIQSLSGLVPCSITVSYNEQANTALILSS